MKILFPFLIFSLFSSMYAHSTLWKVGPNQLYSKPSQVSGLVQDGDTVEIDEGTYLKDVTRWSKNNLLLRGTGEGAHLNAEQTAYGRKAIWVIAGNNTIVENVEFSNCRDQLNRDKNWAGIRQEGVGLIVRNCFFHNNDNGILGGGGATSELIIEHSEFAYNGYGDGYSHNLYIGNIKSLTFSFNYSHHAKVGHELKSRAANNYILYNRIGNEADGTASREIDLPNGGVAIIIGNQIQQGALTSNSGMIGYGLEGLINPAPHQLFLINNTLVNDIQGRGNFVNIKTGTEKYKAYNNIYSGFGDTLSGNAFVVEAGNNLIISSAATSGFKNYIEYDYHLVSSSPAIDKGVDPGKTEEGYELIPDFEYLHPLGKKERIKNVVIDIGAFEFSLPVSSYRSIRNRPVIGLHVNAYPNPYKDRILFHIESKESGKGTLTLYTLSGEMVQTVYEGYLFAGEKQVVDFKVPVFNRTNLIYVLNINGIQHLGKLIKQ